MNELLFTSQCYYVDCGISGLCVPYALMFSGTFYNAKRCDWSCMQDQFWLYADMHVIYCYVMNFNPTITCVIFMLLLACSYEIGQLLNLSSC